MKTGNLIAAAMVGLGILSGIVVLTPKKDETAKQMDEIRASISLFDKKKMYNDAAAKYQELMALDAENYDLAIEYKNYCKEHGFQNQYISACQKALSLKEDDFETAKEYAAWLELNKSDQLYNFVHHEIDILGGNEKDYFSQYYDGIKCNYKIISSKFTEISPWHNNFVLYPDENGYYQLFGGEEYAFAKDSKGKSVVIDKKGAVVFTADEILSYSPAENLISAHNDEQIVYLNSGGLRRIVPFDATTDSLIYYDYLGGFSDGIARCKKGDVWVYINTGAEIISQEYEDASSFSNGLAAVKSDGKWAIIQNDSEGFTKLTDFQYDDVLLDEYGFAFTNGYAYVKESNSDKWSLIRVEMDEELKTITGVTKAGSLSFDDAKPFGVYGAVKSDGKWGFVNMQGEWVIEPQFDDAFSFAAGLAPVKVSDKWGFIDKSGNVVSEPRFDFAGGFNDSGTAYVCDNGSWQIIQLLEYSYKQ